MKRVLANKAAIAVSDSGWVFHTSIEGCQINHLVHAIFHQAGMDFCIVKNQNVAMPQNFSIREMDFLIVKIKNNMLILLIIKSSLL